MNAAGLSRARKVRLLALLILLVAFPNPLSRAGADEAETDGGSSKTKQAGGAAKVADDGLPGDRHIHEAYAQTGDARKVADYTQIVQLCQEGIRAGVSRETDKYARRLMSWAYNRRGELLAEQGHDTIALADFEAAIANDKTRWRAYHNRGVSLALLGRHRSAISDFNRTLEINPQYANAYFNRAEVRYELGDLESAIVDYSRAIKLDPNDVAFYNSRGHTHYRLGKYREAARDFTLAIRLDPHNSEALTNRGDLYTALGYYGRAVRDYQEAIRSNLEFGRAYLSSAWLMATSPNADYRSVEGALDAIEKAVAYGVPKNLRYLETLAAVQANAGDFEAAQATLKRAIQISPAGSSDRYAAKIKQYAQGKPLRIAPQPLAESEPQIASQPRSGSARQSNFEEPVER